MQKEATPVIVVKRFTYENHAGKMVQGSWLNYVLFFLFIFSFFVVRDFISSHSFTIKPILPIYAHLFAGSFFCHGYRPIFTPH